MENEENKKSKNYTDVLLEKINGKFDFLVEESKIVEGKLDSLETKVNSLEIKVDSLETKVDLLVEDMDEVKARLVSVEDEVKDINIKLDNKVDNIVIDNHEKRLIKLEKMSLAKA